MKYSKIICLDFTGDELEAALWEKIDHLCDTRIRTNNIQSISADDLQVADCLLVKLGAHIDKKVIDQLPALKYIGMLGTGYGGIDTAYAASKGITVTNIADYATEGVAEFTFGILLEYLRDISRAKRQARDGDYSDDFVGTEIRCKRFGVIGLGDIGTRTAQLAQAFGADVWYWSRHRKPEIEAAGIRYCELDKLLATSDIVTINLALNAETEGMIHAARIKSLKKQAIVINTSPMELLEFDALVKRLRKNDLTFMLDHSDEMTVEQLVAMQPMNNCIVYPPIAYLSREASKLKKDIYIDNIESFLKHKAKNKVN